MALRATSPGEVDVALASLDLMHDPKSMLKRETLDKALTSLEQERVAKAVWNPTDGADGRGNTAKFLFSGGVVDALKARAEPKPVPVDKAAGVESAILGLLDHVADSAER